MLKKFLVSSLVLSLLIISSFAFSAYDNNIVATNAAGSPDFISETDNTPESVDADYFQTLYNYLHLDVLKLNKQAYDVAIKGFLKMQAQQKLHNDALLTIADFSQPSTQKRLYIIDLKNRKLVMHTHVAHGRNTGMLMATAFSNTAESNQSSLGFYVTAETYNGKHGLSLKLDGVEKNINDNARDRAIVIHGADYANDSFWKSAGYLGRSFGCPSVPSAQSAQIIQTIRGGSCLFIYAADKNYFNRSAFAG